jgi:single-strand DNA-binding protein
MNNLNSILIEGNLVRDPELSYTPKGTAVCKFSLACNRSYKQDDEFQKEVSFFDVSTWTRLAEVCGEYLKKGRGVRVVGRLKQDRWTDPDGKPRSRVEIVAEHVEFKPPIKKQDGDGKDGEEKTEEPAADEQAQEEVKEAVSF